MSDDVGKSASVYHRSKDGVLLPYDSRTSAAIIASANDGSTITLIRVEVSGSNKLITFDLRRMKQLSEGSTEEEDVVIEIPWNSVVFKAAVSLTGDDRLRRKILEMALGRFRQYQFLTAVLDLKSVPYEHLRVNPYLAHGHPPYDVFLDSLT